MHFCIRACDVSALAGRNVFRSRRMAIRRLIESKVQGSKVNHSSCNENRRLLGMIRKGRYYQDALICDKLSSDVCTRAEQECKDVICRVLPDCSDELQNLYKRYQHLYLKDRGLAVEQVVISKLRQAGHNILTVSKKDRTFSKTFTTECGKHTYTIYGCVDGIDEFVDGTRALVEIKSRKQRTLTYLHELDQIVTYLIISGWACGYLVEYVDAKVHTSQHVDLQRAEQTWTRDIRGPLEKSLCDASEKIINLLP